LRVPTREKFDSLALLAGVRRVFAGSQDYESTLSAIAQLVLPYIGSWCAVDVCEDDGSLRRVAVIHPDVRKQHLALALETGWPPHIDDLVGAAAVVRSRTTVSIAHVTDELLRQVARTPENLRSLLAMGIGSVITVPLMARSSVLGAITFVSDATGQDYTASDVVLAENLAGIAALALDNARLHRAAIERAKEDSASRAKSDFLSTMSHEIRTPLNAILGYAELLELGLGGTLSAKQREFVGRMRLSGAHLAELVNDVLDLAKADAGRLEIAGETANTGAAIATAIAATQHAADAANVRIVDATASSSAARDGEQYVGDEKRVRQIVINLMANALKFTPHGGTVTLSCGSVLESPTSTSLVGLGPWAFIRVVDTGPGVAVDRHIAIFEPFVQGDSGLTRSKAGTGLGLTISRRLARLMGGDLTLDTNLPGAKSGATFTLWMPSTDDSRSSSPTIVGELAAPRIARALSTSSDYRVFGLAEIGRHIRGHVEDVLRGIAARLRSDPEFPSAAGRSASEVENHQLSFLVDVVQSLVVIDETGGVDSVLYRHGSEIQRLVSSLHGVMRHQQGWTLQQLDRESAIVHEQLAALVHRHVPSGMGDVTAALAVIEHLVEQSRVAGALAFRRAERNSIAMSA
jgi:signal transduction histidine kinase